MTTTAVPSPPTADTSDSPALDVEGLCVDLSTPAGRVRAVDGVSFSVRRGRTLALLGESGCGKSMTALSVVGLLDPAAEVTGGAVRVRGSDTLRMSPAERRKLAGPVLSIVFQDALTALNPVQPVGGRSVSRSASTAGSPGARRTRRRSS